MKISPTNSLFLNSYRQQKTQNNRQTDSSKSSNPLTANNNIFAYKDYNISFGARLNRTPENFYDQKFNQENMPDTVRNYLMEDFEERHHMPPAQLQREAFKYVGIADTVQDVKDMYPDEPLFKDLRPFSETNARRGTLFLLRWNSQIDNTPIFRDTRKYKDLTLYLLKKVYLEGKTLDEINKDFETDSTYRIKKDLGITDGKYFTYSDLKSLGVKYPKLPYYQSFLATRNDKEYIPPVRKKADGTEDNSSNNIDSQKAKRELSQETIEKLSIAKKKWWASLSEEQRSEQIKRMIEGKELSDSVYEKYQGQIMTIAAGKIGFSEKLSKIYAERYADDEFMQDFNSYTEAQRAVMEEFWNKDSSFRKYYSKILKQTIAEFEDAYNNQDKSNKLERLLNEALEQKNKILDKTQIKRAENQKIKQAQQKKTVPDKQEETNTPQNSEPQIEKQPQVTPIIQKPAVQESPKEETEKDIIRAFRKQEAKALQNFTDIFAAEFLEYVMKNTDTQTKRIAIGINRPDAKDYLNISSDEELNEIEEKMREVSEEINQNFNLTHTSTARTNDFIINNFVYELTGDPEVFKCERGDITNLIAQKPGLSYELTKNKASLNKQMKLLNTPLSEKASAEFFDSIFFTKLTELLDNGFKYYPQLSEQERLAAKKLITVAYATEPIQIKNSSKYIGNYNAAIKFLKNPQNDKKAKEVIFEHMAVDYILWLFKYDSLKKPNGEKVTVSTPEKAEKQQSTGSRKLEGKIDLNSIDSVRNTFRDFAKVQNAFFSKSFSNQLINFNIAHPLATKEVLTAFLIFQTGADKVLPDIKEEEKTNVAESIQNVFNRINEDFDAKYPLLAQANEFSMNQTLYEITKDPEVFKNSRADSVVYIIDHNLEDLVSEKTNLIEKRYHDYSAGLTDKDAIKYLRNTFMADVSNVFVKGMQYHKDIDDRVVKSLLSHIFIETKINSGQEKDYLLAFLKRRRGAIKYISNPAIPDDVKQLLREHLVYDFIYERAKKLQKDRMSK